MTEVAKDRYDIVIIGAGIAGASLAYFLARAGAADVLALEREPHYARHSTGRSAASLVEIDPIPVVEQLKIIGGRFLREEAANFCVNPILDERGVLVLCSASELEQIESRSSDLHRQGMPIEIIASEQATSMLDEFLLPSEFAGAAFLPRDGFIDVHELLTSYLSSARSCGIEFHLSHEVLEVTTTGGRVEGVCLDGRRIAAPLVVNAAGAWAGVIAEQANASRIRLNPLRRSLVEFPPPEQVSIDDWPMVWSEAHCLYFREDAGRILFCPMDQEPMPPSDPSPDHLVFAEGLERLRSLAPRLVPRFLGQSWSGLRTFAPDCVPVVGHDPKCPGFFWLAGQGGCGIETSGAIGRIAADLITTSRTEVFDANLLSPARFVR